ncbi:MAG: ABC transporter ATP-binding protein [Anaerolineaceae bacterium]|nr:MAG: ABC transporter ATP-binding protein [Anaerolineaceae bacterium]
MQNLSNVNEAVLTLNKVCKNFGGVVAAKDISLDLFPGEVFGLIGPNGAGKTTLINLITGIYKVDGGSIVLNGHDITKSPAHSRAKKGITRTFQHPHLLQRCDIETNIYLGVDLAKKNNELKSLDHEKLLDELLEVAGLKLNMRDGIDKLAYGQQKLLEVVRAILTRPSVLLLDEPAAGLNQKEMEHIVALIDIAIKMNSAVLLIEHRMDLVMSICDRITVLNFGNQIANGVPAEIQDNPVVIEAYLGRKRGA